MDQTKPATMVYKRQTPLRELGIGIVAISLLLPWFQFNFPPYHEQYGHNLTFNGVALISHGVGLVIAGYLCTLLAYLISRRGYRPVVNWLLMGALNLFALAIFLYFSRESMVNESLGLNQYFVGQGRQYLQTNISIGIPVAALGLMLLAIGVNRNSSASLEGGTVQKEVRPVVWEMGMVLLMVLWATVLSFQWYIIDSFLVS